MEITNSNQEELDVHSFIKPIYETKKIRATMSNNKQSSVEWLEQMVDNMIMNGGSEDLLAVIEHIQKAKAMQREQAHQYATFVLKCVQNNLPPITFNDWINLEKNEQQ